jgi:hypothetical protein
VILDVPGGEADNAITFDCPNAPAIEADEPKSLVGLREGDASAGGQRFMTTRFGGP